MPSQVAVGQVETVVGQAEEIAADEVVAPGGDRGGRGGGPGGGRGGGPSRGGDPSSFLSRLDRNGNGMIDTDEMQGPAKFMIDRMARDNPKINPNKPISLAKLTESFQKMRDQANSGKSRGDGDDVSRQAIDDAMTLEQLVLGFEREEEPASILGFGAAGELFAVRVTPADEREAKERMARYDRNRDGFLEKNELSDRMDGNPMDFDRNGDGKLSLAEFSYRYARRRVAEVEVREAQARSRQRDESSRDGGRSKEIEDTYGDRQSFRVSISHSDDGLPGWFGELDRDADGQVVMAEYASRWSDDLAREFFEFDINNDGVITKKECLTAVESGATRGSGTNLSAGSATSSREDSKTTEKSSASKPSNANLSPVAADQLDEKYIGYAQRLLQRSDKNQDGVLTAGEWKTMLLDISPSDADRDGRITVEEYAGWMQARSTR